LIVKEADGVLGNAISLVGGPAQPAEGFSAGKSCVVKAGDKLEIFATNEIGEENRASPAVSDGKIFLRGDLNLYCIGKK
jgi:hypothetical protein